MSYIRTGDGPPSLRDPDRFRARDSHSSVVGLEGYTIAVTDCIAHGVLEVRISVHPNEVGRVDDSIIRRVDPGSPCIDNTNWSTPSRSPSDQ